MKKMLLLFITLLLFKNGYLQTLTSSNLPIVIINTNGQEILDDPKITADMGIIYNGEGVRNNITGPLNHYNGKIGIEIRGQSTQMFPMKAYSIELRDATGNSKDKSLFGLPKESDWVLYAPYNEKTLMHNFLAYTIARQTGHWAANCRYVEVVLNGEYNGIYLMLEKIKRNSGRVNIPKMAVTDVTGDAVTGGYIFSIDKEANGWFSAFKPGLGAQQIQFSYVYPKIENIVPQQAAYIKSYTDSFETALSGSNYQNKQTGWRNFANEASFIDYFVVNEVSRNVDGYRLSSYFYKDRNSNGGKIVAGPAWDYDLAFRNANYCNGSNIQGWAYQFNKICSDDYWQVPFWWDRFMADTAFTANLKCRWKELRQTVLSEGNLNSLVDSIVALTEEARTRHFVKWPVLGQYVWPNPEPVPATYGEEITTLKNWLSARLKWLDDNIPNNGACADYPPGITAGIIASVYPIPSYTTFTLNVISKQAQTIKVVVYAASGQTVLNTSYSLAKGTNLFNIGAGRWQAGLYFIKIESSNGDKYSQKLLKQ